MSDRDEWDYEPFKVGDMVELFGLRLDVNLNGSRVEILGSLPGHYLTDVMGAFGNRLVGCENFRRRNPPMTGLEDVLAMFDKQPDRVKELV